MYIDIPGLVGPPPEGSYIATFSHLEKRHKINNHEQWNNFVHDEPAPRRPRLTIRQLARLSELERVKEGNARIAHLAGLSVPTPFMDYVEKQLFPLVRSNLLSQKSTARYGIGLDGNGGSGKSTILEELCRVWTRRRLCLAAEVDWDDGRGWAEASKKVLWTPESTLRSSGLYVPVVVWRLIGTVTELSFLGHAYSYFGMPLPKRGSVAAHIDLLLAILDACGAEILVIDEFHAFKPYMRGYDEVSHFVKALMDGTSTTLVASGQELGTNQLLSEGRFGLDGADTSTSRRISRLDVGYFPLVDPGDRAIWTQILENFDPAIVLANHEPGSLVEHADLLHFLTQGAMGTLMSLLVRALTVTIGSGEERLTTDLLESIVLSNGATMHSHPEEDPEVDDPTAPRPRPKRPKRSTKSLTKGRGVPVR